MKSKLFILLFSFAALTATTQAQVFTIPKDVVKKSAVTSYASALAESPAVVVAPVQFSSFALQLTFTQLTREEGNWKAGNLFTVGESYLWSWANGRFNQDSSITVESKLSLGVGFNFGVTPNETGVLVGSLPLGAIVQYSSYGLFAGYDMFNQRPLIGISYKIPNFPILQGATKFSKLPK